MVDVNGDAATLLEKKERTEYGAEAGGHRETLPAAGLSGSVVAAENAVNRKVAVAQEQVYKKHESTLCKELPGRDVALQGCL